MAAEATSSLIIRDGKGKEYTLSSSQFMEDNPDRRAYVETAMNRAIYFLNEYASVSGQNASKVYIPPNKAYDELGFLQKAVKSKSALYQYISAEKNLLSGLDKENREGVARHYERIAANLKQVHEKFIGPLYSDPFEETIYNRIPSDEHDGFLPVNKNKIAALQDTISLWELGSKGSHVDPFAMISRLWKLLPYLEMLTPDALAALDRYVTGADHSSYHELPRGIRFVFGSALRNQSVTDTIMQCIRVDERGKLFVLPEGSENEILESIAALPPVYTNLITRSGTPGDDGMAR